MKRLLLVRHAKSDWGDPSLRDHDRPLNARGLRDAPRMARALAERGIRPELLLASTALRALTTAELMAAELGVDVTTDDRLYGAPAETLLRVAAGADEGAGTLMLVAHDPGMSELAWSLDHAIERMPTCAVAQFDFDVELWTELPDAAAVASRFDAP